MEHVIEFVGRFIEAERQLKVLQRQAGIDPFNAQFSVYQEFLSDDMKGRLGIVERRTDPPADRLAQYAQQAPPRAREFFKLESYEHGDLGTIYFAYVSMFTPPLDLKNVDEILVVGEQDGALKIVNKIPLSMGYANVEEFKYFNLDTDINVSKFTRLNGITRLQAPDNDQVPYIAEGILDTPATPVDNAESMMETATLRYRADELDGDDGAISWLQKAHAAGAPEAAVQMVLICRDRGQDSGPEGSEAWAQKAIDNGDPRGYNEIGITRYFQGNKDGSDDSAMAWYRKAADHGVADAYFNMGEVRDEQGRLDPSDEDGAVHWYRQASAHNNPDAAARLVELGLGT